MDKKKLGSFYLRTLYILKLNSSFGRSRENYYCLLVGRAGYTLGFAGHFLVACIIKLQGV